MRGIKSKTKGILQPDKKYSSTTVAKFINYVMLDGQKKTAEKIVYDSLELSSKKIKKEPLDVFQGALNNVAPLVEVKSRRIGGANYQVPIEVREPRRTALALKWILNAARAKKGTSMANKLAGEFQDAFNSTGAAIKKREDTHKMAEANKAFAHFARLK